MACKMLIMSRGPTPNAFMLRTRSCNVTERCRMPSRRSFWSSIEMLVRGTTWVVPLDSGTGLADLRRFRHPDG